jgi:hypothetical protein
METVIAIASIATSLFVVVGGVIFIIITVKGKNKPNRLF